jgi:hypothetical protein
LKLEETQLVGDEDEVEEDQWEPILKPWELEPPPVKKPVKREEDIEKQIEEFAGPDRSTWFEGDELKAWRAARLCVAHLMDRLDRNSFAILPAKEEGSGSGEKEGVPE